MYAMPHSSQPNSQPPGSPASPSGNPANTFGPAKESASTRRLVIGTGIAVLVLAAIAAIVAGAIGLSKPQPQPITENFPSSDSVDAIVPQEVSDLTGTYSGAFRNAIQADNPSTWFGAVSITGDEGLLVYPRQGCQVFLSDAQIDNAAVVFKANPLNSKCNPTGTWSFTQTEDGIVAEYVEGGQIIVAAMLTRE